MWNFAKGKLSAITILIVKICTSACRGSRCASPFKRNLSGPLWSVWSVCSFHFPLGLANEERDGTRASLHQGEPSGAERRRAAPSSAANSTSSHSRWALFAAANCSARPGAGSDSQAPSGCWIVRCLQLIAGGKKKKGSEAFLNYCQESI